MRRAEPAVHTAPAGPELCVGAAGGPPNPRSGHVRALPLDSANPLTPLGGRCSRPPARSQAGVQTTSLGTGGTVSAGCRARHPHTFPTAPSHSSREQKSRGSPTSFVSALQRHRAASSHETPPPWVPLSVDAWKRGCARLGAASCGVLPAARGARCRAVSTLPGVPCLHARRPPPPSAPTLTMRRPTSMLPASPGTGFGVQGGGAGSSDGKWTNVYLCVACAQNARKAQNGQKVSPST